MKCHFEQSMGVFGTRNGTKLEIPTPQVWYEFCRLRHIILVVFKPFMTLEARKSKRNAILAKLELFGYEPKRVCVVWTMNDVVSEIS
jgi:adenylate cyclase